mgnify:CR=1 FL=1
MVDYLLCFVVALSTICAYYAGKQEGESSALFRRLQNDTEVIAKAKRRRTKVRKAKNKTH